MTCNRIPRSTLRTLAIAALALTGTPAATGHAAQQPESRYVGLDRNGQELRFVAPVAVAAGGNAVLFNGEPQAGDRRGYLRDLTRNVTEELPEGATFLDGSDDLSVTLVSTKVSYSPDDTNQAADGYVLDRRTGAISLFTRASTGGPALGRGATDATISGDGRIVVFSDIRRDAADMLIPEGPRSYDVATGRVASFTPKQRVVPGAIDTAGRVWTGREGVVIRGAFTALPESRQVVFFESHDVVASDGSAVAWREPDERIGVLLTASGTVLHFTPPAAVVNRPTLQGVTSGGNYVQIAWLTKDLTTTEYAVVNVRTGALTMLATQTDSTEHRPRTVSPDLGFSFEGPRLLSVRGAAIPGSTPSVRLPPAKEYLTYYPGCAAAYVPLFSYNPAIRPSLVLTKGTAGAHPRKPVSASITVQVTATGAVASRFVATPGQRVSLYGGFGGTTISGRVTFDDGSTAELYERIARYKPETNSFGLYGGPSACALANGGV